MWFAKRGWQPQAGQSAFQNANIHIPIHHHHRLRRHHHCCHQHHHQHHHHVGFYGKSLIPFIPSCVRCTVVQLCACLVRLPQSSMGVALRWRACSAQFVILTMLPIPVVRCTLANLRFRPSTFCAFQTSPLPLPRATVATRLRQISLSVSGPSAMRALGQSRQGSSWWSTPPPGRGRGTGWEGNPFGAPRELGVYRWTTPLTGEIPALSGAAATTTCQRTCGRLVVAGVQAGPSPIVRCWEVLVVAPASGPERTNALWRRLQSVPVACPFATPVGNAWQSLLPPLPQTLGVLVWLLCTRLPMVAQGVWARRKLHIPQSPFAVKSASTTLLYLSYLSLYFFVILFANAVVVPDHRLGRLCRAPCLPPLALFESPAAAPQREFWLPVVIRHALMLAVLRSSLLPWPFCRRAPLTLSDSPMRTSLAAAMRTLSSMSGAVLRRWGRRPCWTAKMDRGRRGRNI